MIEKEDFEKEGNYKIKEEEISKEKVDKIVTIEKTYKLEGLAREEDYKIEETEDEQQYK